MGEAPQSRVLAIMGSGETSPTMVNVHKALTARLSGGHRRAVLLDTPYAFQENASDISARTQAYFARSVGLRVDVVSDADLPPERSPGAADALAAIRFADWLFAGPGSPSYALRRWRGNAVAVSMRDRLAAGAGVTIIASAAAAAIGLLAIPVYEIYKVGADPYWLEGLDLLAPVGLRAVVIPHYDNAEGGTHDTRFCYLGERRLAMLEPQIPADAAVLGVDEHTALVFDMVAGEAEVVGRGGATVRKAGVSAVLPAGSRITMPDLRELIRSGPAGSGHSPGGRPVPAETRTSEHERAGAPTDTAASGNHDPLARELPEITKDAQQRFETAERARDGAAMVAAILDLEAGIEAWATDTDENDNADRARAVLRAMIVQLGKAAEEGLADPGDRLRPGIEPLIALRASLRKDGAYAAADTIRDALVAAGVEVHDSPEGTRWAITRQASPGVT
jgi:hypothetical protein